MKTKTLYIAFDDREFDTAEACKAHEAAHVEMRLVGLTIEQVRAALAREDTGLAEAIEEIGTRINRARRAAGDLRRGKTVSAGDGRVAEIETADVADAKAAAMAEAIRRARKAGRAAWDAKQGATVPEAFAGAQPIADAWLEGWRDGQAEAADLRLRSASDAVATA